MYVLTLLTALLIMGPSTDDTVESHPLVARLVSSQKEVAPGAECLVAIELEMKKGWHTYWHSPHDGGMPIQVDWKLPPGCQASELQWPVPERFLEDELVCYGYHDEVLLIARIRVPAEIDAEQLVFGAKVRWLVCSDRCLLGKANLEITMPIATSTPRPTPELGKIVNWLARVPKPADPKELRVEQSWKPENEDLGRWTVSWDLAPLADRDTLRVFPFDPRQGRVDEPSLEIEQLPQGAAPRAHATFRVTTGGSEFDVADLAALIVYEEKRRIGNSKPGKPGRRHAVVVRYRAPGTAKPAPPKADD